jgi:hypothetical protein
MTNKHFENIFSYHATTDTQVFKYSTIREMAKQLAYLIDHSCPDSHEKSVAIMHLQNTVMWANASIAINEPSKDA